MASNRERAWHFDTGRDVFDAASTHGGWIRILMAKYWSLYADSTVRRRCFDQAILHGLVSCNKYVHMFDID